MSILSVRGLRHLSPAFLSKRIKTYKLDDDKKIRIVGKRSKKIYQLGQNINILVINTDINKRNIDLEIV